MSRRLLCSLACALLAIALSLGLVQAQSPGVITGRVINRTVGEATVPGQRVVLFAFRGQERFEPRLATTDAAGQFRFEGLALGEDILYVVATEFGGVTYISDRATLTPASPAAGVDLDVFEPVASDADIRLESATVLLAGIDPEAGQVQVLEMLTIANVGTHTIVAGGSSGSGTRSGTVHLTVADGAVDVMPQFGLRPEDVQRLPDGLVATTPVPPGRWQVVLSYRLNYRSSRLQLRKTIPYPADEVRLLSADQRLGLTSPQLAPAGTIELQGRSYRALAGRMLPAGTRIIVEVSGLPVPATEQGEALRHEQRLAAGIGAGIVALALAAGLLVRVLLKRPAAALAVEEGDGLLRATLEALARLDDAYAAGAIGAEQYQHQRAVLKQRALELAARNGSPPGPLALRHAPEQAAREASAGAAPNAPMKHQEQE